MTKGFFLWALHPLLAANGPISGTRASAQHSSFVAVLFRKSVLICQQDDTVLSLNLHLS